MIHRVSEWRSAVTDGARQRLARPRRHSGSVLGSRARNRTARLYVVACDPVDHARTCILAGRPDPSGIGRIFRLVRSAAVSEAEKESARKSRNAIDRSTLSDQRSLRTRSLADYSRYRRSRADSSARTNPDR